MKGVLSEGQVSRGDHTILVVDDDPSVLKAVKVALEEMNYNFLSARSGEEALSKFEKNNVDIVLSDIRMPKMSGLELLRKIKERSPETYVIVMTAYASVDSAVEAMKEGASDYIRKPIELKDMKTTIMGIIEDLEFDEVRGKNLRLHKKDSTDPLKTFKKLVDEGRHGIFVARKLPSDLGQIIDDKVTFLPFSSNKGSNVASLDLENIKDQIKNNIDDSNGTVIFLDDLDYFFRSNSLDDFKKFIESLEKEIMDESTFLLLSGKKEELDREHRDELEYIISDTPVSVISESISNHIRRKIISELKKRETSSFTTLSSETGVEDSPKLSFHLRKLETAGLIKKDRERRYKLTERGLKAADTINTLRNLEGEGFGKVAWFPA